MLEKLSLKHSLWVKMARGICKDAFLADDLVSEMYLKFSQYDENKEVNDFYVYYAIKHIYINWLREEKKLQTIELNDNFVTFEENERITIELPNCISWVEKQILLLRQEYSCREISLKYDINKDKINRIELKAKEKLILWGKKKLMDLEM